VEVNNPYKDVQPGVKPPLVKGMFVEVEIRGKPVADQLVIPRSALDNQHVYVADAYNRLERRAVQTKPGGASFVIVQSGLQAGERVVISDVSPAISGMLLEPVVDNETLTSLVNAASATSGTAANTGNQGL
jgi:multidrug efflux pump subunit AcrA (membrane-fusion protein)